jgi:plastocyanin
MPARISMRKNLGALALCVPACLLVVIAVALVTSGCGSSTPGTTVGGASGATTTVAVGNAGAVPLEAMPFTVSIAKGALSKTKLEVPLGSAVDFKNAEDDTTAQHQFVADGGSFDSMVLNPGGEFVVVFTVGGTFAFHDALNPDIKGSIVVTASATAPEAGIVPTPGSIVRVRQGTLSVASVQVKVGDSVIFVNTEDDTTVNHQMVADDGSFTTGVLRPNMMFTVTFQKVGTYTYHDQLHPDIKGTITVK